MTDLHPFPAQPEGTPWPTADWPEGEAAPEVAGLERPLDALLGPHPDPAVGHTNAVAVVHRGRIVAERYGEREMGPLAELAGIQPGPLGPDDLLGSWSMAKSVLHLAVGVAQARGQVEVEDPAPVPEWHDADDPRRAITWDDLLTMRPGLGWTEVYEGFDDDSLPDVVTMLYGGGAADMAAYAADKPLVAEPGSAAAYCYSSGTTNIIARCLSQSLGATGSDLDQWVREALFDPIGASSVTFGHDGSGLWVASSYLDMTARDWLRLGLLVLRGGTWDGTPLVPAGWIDHGRHPRSMDEGKLHGAQWWSWPDRDDGLFMAHGFEGQRLIMVPGRDLVVFRQGKTALSDIDALNEHVLGLVDLFPVTERV